GTAPSPRDPEIAARKVGVRRNGIARIRIKCPRTASRRCRGSLTLFAGRRRIGRAKFTVTAGRKAVVRVRLSSYGRRLVRRRRSLRVTAVLSSRDASGRRSVVFRRITLKRRR
ncbi:MAG: hypothetical protein H0V29_12385, partial [Thermoleophilaceae bacterium]|nr:hypothetical protein [Thermoleophilaceae bacterium]